jgi:hypothetical protein
VAVLAAIVGGMIGAGGVAIQTLIVPWQTGELVPVSDAIPADAPRIEAFETTHQFGTIGTGMTGSHRFEIRNAGGSPLSLTRGSSSCSCTVSDFEATEGSDPDASKRVPPGESTFVTVKWRGKPPGGPFQQQVTVLTDDPRRPEVVFVVEGTVVPTWRAVPDSIAIDQLATSTGRKASTTIYTYGDSPPNVTGIAIDGSDAEQFFALTTAPLPAEDVASQPSATGGFRIDVEIKPGLPIGPLRRTITATFAMPDEVTADVPLEGTVGGDLVIAGPGWDTSRQRLVLGTVSGRSGFRRKIFLLAKGPHRDLVSATVREVVPDSLEVTVGPGAAIGSGGVVRFPIDLVIRPGSRAVNHLCSEQGPAGRIVLDTGHPDSPSLVIPVCVAIGP